MLLDTMPYPDTLLTENRFWLQIMGDHARFIFFSLAPTESEYILTAQQFILIFDELLNDVQKKLTSQALEELLSKAYSEVYRFREFKLELLSMSLTSDLNSHLPPTFINDMLNELEEYLQLLMVFREQKPTLLHPLHYHMLWLSDAVGHCATIAAQLDPAEKDLIELSSRYELQFEDLYTKALFMNGYLRTQLTNFPSLNRLNDQAAIAIRNFIEFLDNLRDQKADNKVLGTLMPLMADHMSREECYYLWKLSQTADTVHRPDCDPARPRMYE
jgi:hypothetical protein